jgi:threonine/homoserine/homoserine lactone efflux protein
MLDSLAKGLIIGFSIAAPVGPIGILCINRSLHEGYKSGFITGCGAATADGFYGFVAGFGLTFISSFLINHQFWIRFIGGIFLIYLGIKTLVSVTKEQALLEVPKNRLLGAYSTTFFLTLSNPLTILSFAAVFAGLGIGSMKGGYLEASVLVMGVVIGSLLWWLLLCSGVSIFLRNKIKPKVLLWINRFSGMVLLAFGIAAFVSLVQ